MHICRLVASTGGHTEQCVVTQILLQISQCDEANYAYRWEQMCDHAYDRKTVAAWTNITILSYNMGIIVHVLYQVCTLISYRLTVIYSDP